MTEGTPLLQEKRLKERLEKLTQIGIALSAERNLDRLLERIVEEARALTNADGGTLYLVEGDPPQSIRYYIMQTGSTHFRAGGTSTIPIRIPNLPLQIDGKPNHANISAYTANTGQTLNIPDWRTYPGFDFTGPRKYEADTGYVSRSFLVVALRDHEDQIIGVLQLLNCLDQQTGKKIPFSSGDVGLIEALASQAAVAFTNAKLIRDLEHLFDSFAEVMAAAIDERSKATSGHIRRVTTLTMALAQAVNAQAGGQFAGVRLTEEELKELRLAALLHDVGKITTPIHIVEKVNKLDAVYDRGREVFMRFEYMKKAAEAEYCQQKLTLLESGAPPAALAELEAGFGARVAELTEEQAFLQQVNSPVEFMPPEKAERIKLIGAKRFTLTSGEERPYLDEDELKNLVVQRGNITGDELAIMRDHARVSIELLSQIPFTRRLRSIPAHAGAHHEFLNGKGYPLGLKGDQISLQTRMMTIADIYDAITASDRSYKKAVSQEAALNILRKAAQFGETDPDLVELFIASGAYKLCGKPTAQLEAEAREAAVVRALAEAAPTASK